MFEASLTRAVVEEAQTTYLSRQPASMSSMSPTGVSTDQTDNSSTALPTIDGDLVSSSEPSVLSDKGSQGKTSYNL